MEATWRGRLPEHLGRVKLEIIKSYSSLAFLMKSAILFESNNSDGLGGITPEVTKSKFSTCLFLCI